MSIQIFQSLTGLFILLSITFMLSENKSGIKRRNVMANMLVYSIFTFTLIKLPGVSTFMIKVNTVLQSISHSSIKGANAVFGDLALQDKSGFVLAIQSLPVLITVSALSSLLIKLRILPLIISALSFIFKPSLQIGGTLGVAISANVFAGMAETPLVIRPYIKNMSRSELFSLMLCGAAGMSSSVIILLSIVTKEAYPNAVYDMMRAVLISIPCSILVARILVPEDRSLGNEFKDISLKSDEGIVESIFNGIVNGGKTVAIIAVMLIGFIALIDVINNSLSLLPNFFGHQLSIQRILGFFVSPITWLIGIPAEDILVSGSLIGSKFAFNEIIGFQELVKVSGQISARSVTLLTYAMSGFGNIGSVGVLLGVYSSLVPERKKEVLGLAFKAVIGGTIVNLINAALVSIFI